MNTYRITLFKLRECGTTIVLTTRDVRADYYLFADSPNRITFYVGDADGVSGPVLSFCVRSQLDFSVEKV